MRRLIAATALSLTVALPAHAGTREAVEGHILPGTARFAEATQALSETAAGDCTPAAVQPAYYAAFDAWQGIAHLRFGPLETDGRVNAIAFWPDTRGFTPKTLAGLIADADPVVGDPAHFAEVSVAGRGFFALDYMLFDDQFAGYAAGTYSCRLVQALAADLARMAADIDSEWRTAEAPLLLEAGAEGNTRYLGEEEALRTLYTALMTGLEFNADTRLGRPLGTFDRPRPTRAEAWRSGRPARNTALSLAALEDLAIRLAAPLPVAETLSTAFATALEPLEALDDPAFAGVADPSGRLRVEIIQQRVGLLRATVSNVVGEGLGVAAGFNSADGD